MSTTPSARGWWSAPRRAGQAGAVTVVGWNNNIPDQVVIGEGATIYPLLKPGHWKKVIAAGEVLK